MFDTNGFKEGYHKGLEHAKSGKKKDARCLPIAKALLYGNSFMDTFLQGYDKGYAEGLQRRKNGTQK